MKKQKINVELHLADGGIKQLGETAYDQLLAHQDIVYNYIPGEGDEDDPAKHIFPYHAVNFAIISRKSQTVEAPVDSICKEA